MKKVNKNKKRKFKKTGNTLSIWLVFALGLSYNFSMEGVTTLWRTIFMAITIFMVSMVITTINDSVRVTLVDSLIETDKKLRSQTK